MRTISADETAAAMTRLQYEIQLADFAAAACRKIISLDGKYITKKLLPDLQALFPDCHLYLDSHSYSDTRYYVNIRPPFVHSYGDTVQIVIGTQTGTARRVCRETISDAEAGYIEKAKQLRASAESLQDITAQWNNLAPYLTRLAGELYAAYSNVQYAPDFSRIRW